MTSKTLLKKHQHFYLRICMSESGGVGGIAQQFLGNMGGLEQNIGNLVGKFRYFFRFGLILSRNSRDCD